MIVNIFGYTDYRKFLKDYYDRSKEANAGFSYRSFALKAGFKSSAFLPLIISGKRNLTKDFIPNFSRAMGLSKREHRYFEALVWFNQSKTEESKRYYLELLQSIRKDRSGALIKDEQFEYLSNWHYPVIREMVALPGFQEDRFWIKRQLKDKVTARQIRDALERMIKLGLLVRDENGRLRQANVNVTTEDMVRHTAVYTIHQQMLSLAKDILAETSGTGNEFSTITMSVSKRQFDEVRKMIHDFQNDVMRYLEDHPDVGESVAQFNTQLFHVVGGGKGGPNA